MYHTHDQTILQVKNNNFLKFFCLTNRFFKVKQPVRLDILKTGLLKIKNRFVRQKNLKILLFLTRNA